MKNLFAIFLVSLLAACGGDGGGGTDTSASPTVTFSQGGETLRIDRLDEYGISVPSFNNTITIGARSTVTFVLLSGSNNTLIAEDRVLIRSVDVVGANNTVTLGGTVTVPVFTITGSNAIVTIGPNDEIGQLNIHASNAVVRILNFSANVPVIRMSGSNITLTMPAGFGGKTTITNTGANNQVIEVP
jgi:hypothetical protein